MRWSASSTTAILPGVGSFGAGMAELRARGLDKYVLGRVAAGTKLLGICLGMQFLLGTSYEEGEWEGLGIVPGRVVRFAEGKIPQIGWNRVFRLRTPLFDGIAEDTRFYFVHSYRAGRAVPPRKERGGGAAPAAKLLPPLSGTAVKHRPPVRGCMIW